jgi:hypothetical protein
MTWVQFHSTSEELASRAEIATRSGEQAHAVELYRAAAEAEEQALSALPPEKARTLGITAVSAASLWFMSRDYARAQQVAYTWLSTDSLPLFATRQLRDLLQTVWGEERRAESEIRFLPGDITVSVSGGEILYGAAPLDLILQKVEEIKAFVVRTVEMKLGQPLRRGKTASESVREYFEPWLIQQPAGSYQFAVRVRTPQQTDFFPESMPEIATITTTTLDILRASVEDPEKELEHLVPDKDYRATFLKLARNLAPTGKTFQQLSVGSATAAAAPVVMLPASRLGMNEALRRQAPRIPESDLLTSVEIRGILRGLSLEKDWLDVAVKRDDGTTEEVRIHDAGETLDDVIGPMVNRRVIVDAYRRSDGIRLHLRDIQSEE